MTSSDTRARVDNIIFNETLRRFTQDSPVLGDVWQEYMALGVGHHGDERVDLLLEPHRRSSPEALCEALRRRLSNASETTRRQRLTEPPKEGVGLSFNDSHVVARLSLGELIRAALPLTKWWHQYVWEPTASSGKRLDAGTIRSKATRRGLAQRLDASGVRPRDQPGENHEAGYARLLWLVRVVGTIAFYGDGGPADTVPTGAQLVESLWKTVQGMDTGTAGDEHDLWSVSRNRAVHVSTWKSVVSTKADAATRLFDLSCSKLTWAVIDSGIDATHPAFRRRQGEQAVALDREAIGRCTRVKKTYDFNLLRELTQVEIDDDVDGLAHLTSETRATVQELRQGLRSGRIIDWGGLESALQLTTGGRPPMSEHGTHVAGILAGDWRDGDDEDEAPPKARLHGMCPDLTLYDLRVLDDEGSGSEFSVLAALQFVRYLNSGKNQPVIDGVNVSMSIRHDVANYACGRTPVCDECERVVASGVVVVAAAGNAGYRTGEGGGQSYEAISITDPGNAEEVITVGATHRSKPHTYGVSYFSSRGPTGDGRRKPDLVAPGEKIMAPVPNGGAKALDGTSMAAPHVSGAAALLMAGHPELRGEPARIKQILCDAATDLGRERNFQGHGMVDILRALQAV
jgi:serine protease AprX